MSIKKLISIIMAATVIAALLSSCDMPFAKPVQTETQTETTTIPQADLSVWADKYEEFLLSVINGTQTVVGYELEVENCRFGVEYIDSDEIPELLISEGDFPGSKVSIFGYDGFEIRLIGSVGENGEFDYLPRENKIFSSEPGEGQDSFIVYSIEEYKIKETFNAASLEGEEGLQYFINDEEVSEEDYTRLLDENKPEETKTVGRDLYELKSEYVLPVVENNTELIDKAIEENSLKAQETTAEEITAEYAATPSEYETEYTDVTALYEESTEGAEITEYYTSSYGAPDDLV